MTGTPWYPSNDTPAHECFPALRRLIDGSNLKPQADAVVAELDVVVTTFDIRRAYFDFLDTVETGDQTTPSAATLASLARSGLGQLDSAELSQLAKSKAAIEQLTELVLNTSPMAEPWVRLLELAGDRHNALAMV